MDKEQISQDVLKEFGELQGERYNWENHWTEIAERVFPNNARLFTDLANQLSKGEKRNIEIYDSTAPLALDRFGSIMDSLLTPRNQKWHKLVPSDVRLLKNRETKAWFETVNDMLFKYRYTHQANFGSQNHLHWLSLGAFGTAGMYIDQPMDGRFGLRYKHINLAEMFVSENHQGTIDKVFRRYFMTARQIRNRWKEKISKPLLEKLSNKTETQYEVVHCVKPNDYKDPVRVDYKGMDFYSVYIFKESGEILEEGGYTSFPFAISRYKQTPGETYGRSIAMDALPAIKTLNEQKKAFLKQSHRTLDPVLLAHDDGIIDGFDLRPGAINFGGISADGRTLVQPLPTGRLDIGVETMGIEQKMINDLFLITLFQVLVETPEMTATEVMERAREKAILLAPAIVRQQSEYLGPMIEREVDLLARQGLIPSMPEAMREAEGEYEITYDSPITRTQRAEEAAGFMRTMEQTLAIVNITQDPAPLDNFNFDVVVPELADIGGVPVRWMNSKENKDQIRQARAQQLQQQQQIQAAPAEAAMIKAQAVAQEKSRG